VKLTLGRSKTNRPRDKTPRAESSDGLEQRLTADGLEISSDTIGSSSRRDFRRRAVLQSRSGPRQSDSRLPVDVRGEIARRRKQARSRNAILKSGYEGIVECAVEAPVNTLSLAASDKSENETDIYTASTAASTVSASSEATGDYTDSHEKSPPNISKSTIHSKASALSESPAVDSSPLIDSPSHRIKPATDSPLRFKQPPSKRVTTALPRARRSAAHTSRFAEHSPLREKPADNGLSSGDTARAAVQPSNKNYREKFKREQSQPGHLETDSAPYSRQGLTGAPLERPERGNAPPVQAEREFSLPTQSAGSPVPPQPRLNAHPLLQQGLAADSLNRQEPAFASSAQPRFDSSSAEPLAESARHEPPGLYSYERAVSASISERPANPLHERPTRLRLGGSADDSSVPSDKSKSAHVSFGTDTGEEPALQDNAGTDSPVESNTPGDASETAEPVQTGTSVVSDSGTDSSYTSIHQTDLAEPVPVGDSPVKKQPPLAMPRVSADKSSKLRFTKGEAANPKQSTSGRKAVIKGGRFGANPDKSCKKRSKKRSKKQSAAIAKSRGVTNISGSPETKADKQNLRFDNNTDTRCKHGKGAIVAHPVKLGANAAVNYGHRKLRQAEDDNVGTQAAHRTESMGESILRFAYRRYKNAPYRKATKLDRKSSKLDTSKPSAYSTRHRAFSDNPVKTAAGRGPHPDARQPRLQSNPLSRMAQRHKIKRQYAKAAREAKSTARRVKNAADAVGKFGRAAVHTVVKHPGVIGSIAALVFLLILISSLITACSNIVSGIGASVLEVSYLAGDTDINSAELVYTQWETELRERVNGLEDEYPGYDEYRVSAGEIGHDPHALMAFLTAMYRDFTFSEAEAILRQLFAEQYVLTLTPAAETRYYMDADGMPVPYNWHILTAALEPLPFTDVIFPYMNAEQREHYEALTQSRGGRQYAGNPFDFDWLPYVSSYFGYRIHPISGEKEYHKGIDIAVPAGTDIRAAHEGTVTYAGFVSSYGNIVVVEDGEGLVTKYAHCDSISASAGQTVAAGEVIAKAGSTGNSTGPHLHFEVIKNGEYLNPIYFSLSGMTGSVP
jgi:hypothetical protein